MDACLLQRMQELKDLGGVIGLAVDAITGGLYKLSPAQLAATLAKQTASVARTRDGVYVILVPAAETGWLKVGQLRRSDATSLPAE